MAAKFQGSECDMLQMKRKGLDSNGRSAKNDLGNALLGKVLQGMRTMLGGYICALHHVVARI
jgi:hypothetical protein